MNIMLSEKHIVSMNKVWRCGILVSLSFVD